MINAGSRSWLLPIFARYFFIKQQIFYFVNDYYMYIDKNTIIFQEKGCQIGIVVRK